MIQPKSIRNFLGAKNYELSRSFYQDLGFSEIITSPTMSYFGIKGFGFYLQDYYIEDWVNNSMVFLEVEDLKKHLDYIKSKSLKDKYPSIKITEIQYNDWGNEFFLHDPSNILWHIGEFKKL